MGDLTYWLTVGRTSAFFVLWTFGCAALVLVAEQAYQLIVSRRRRA